ncbi:glycosyltransferase family 39 protein [Almyronema epifaneia]|uniref:Glycosyltransferase family 39 protein n=1 Tax=Almyronema epifaneia S1 TaxID=2991925 RepID=A0ABW6IKP4_9CYAN
MRRLLAFAVIALLVAGFIFRFGQLEHKVFWIDETFTALRVSGYDESEVVAYFQAHPLLTAADLQQFQTYSADNGASDTIQGLARYEPHLPPAYFLLVREWAHWFGSSPGVIRSFSAVVGLLSLLGIYLLAVELFKNKRAGWIAATLMAISPFHVLYSQEARPYSLWTLTLLGSSWLFLRAVRLNRLREWWLYAIAVTLALYTFLFSIFFVLGNTLYLLVQTRNRRIYRRYLIFTSIAIASFIPWLLIIWQYRQQSFQVVEWALKSSATSRWGQLLAWGLHFTRAFVDFEQTYPFNSTHLWPYLLVVLSIWGLVGYACYDLWYHAEPRAWQWLVCLIATPAVGLILLDLWVGGEFGRTTRYVVPCLIGAELAVAFCLANQTSPLRSQERRKVWMWILVGVYSLGTLSCASGVFAVSGWHKSGGYIPYVAAAINQTPQPLVISDFDLWILSLSHYLKPTTVVEMFDSTRALPPVPEGFSHYFLVNAPPGFVQTWATQSDYQFLPFEQLDQVPAWCMQIASQPKTCPPFSS